MLIDIKYHVTSLVAVFLALAVGILIGGSFVSGPSIERRVANGLEREFRELRAENHQQQQTIAVLQDNIRRRTEFESTVMPLLVNHRLYWRRVAIIQTGDYSIASQSAKSALEAAGANVVSVTTLSDIELESSKERIDRAIELITGDVDVQDPIGKFLGILANSIVKGSGPEAMKILENKHLVSASGDYGKRAFYIVLVGGISRKHSKRAQQIDVPLIDKLQEAGVVTLVGTEPVDAATSCIQAYHSKSIPTVDNVDEPIGQVGLVYAISGETGNFGVKKSADKIVPEFLENERWRNK